MQYPAVLRHALLFLVAVILGCAKESAENGGAGRKSKSAVGSKRADISGPDSRVDESGNNSAGQADKDKTSDTTVALQSKASTFVTDDMFGAVVLYPRKLLAEPSLAEVNLARLIDEAMPEVGFSVTDVEQVVWLLSNPDNLKRTLITTLAPPSGHGQTSKTQLASTEPPQVEPPVNLDDLFEGLEPAKPVPPDEERNFEFEEEPDTPSPEAGNVTEVSGPHAFDLYWTPKFLPMILRFAESSKADRFARMLTKNMSEVEWSGAAYFRQEQVSGNPPTAAADSSPAIRQYLGLEPMCVYVPDVYTVVLATEPRIKSMATARDSSVLDLDPAFEEVLDAKSATAGATGVIDFRRLRGTGTHESLLEEISEQCLSSRMALLNLADDASVVTFDIDVSAKALVELDFASPNDAAARERLAGDVKNLAKLISAVKTPGRDSLATIISGLLQGISIEESGSEISMRAQRPEQFELIPPVAARLLAQVVSEAEEALWRHSLRQLAIAMRNYAADHQQLPPSATYDEKGKLLLSWRVHLLPYLGHEELYEQFQLDEPWNSPHNIKLLDRMPKVYGKTGADSRVLVFTGPGTLFPPGGGTSDSVLNSANAGSTILLVRTADTKPVAWTEPIDLDVSSASVQEVLGSEGSRILAAFCDGTVRYVVPGQSPLEEMARPKRN